MKEVRSAGEGLERSCQATRAGWLAASRPKPGRIPFPDFRKGRSNSSSISIDSSIPRVGLGTHNASLGFRSRPRQEGFSHRPWSRGAVRPDRVTLLRHLRGPGPLEQHRVGETLDLRHRNAGFLGDLLHGRAAADPGLDLAGAELAVGLDLELAAGPNPDRWWLAPIFTVSQSEGGFEKVYQGSSIFPVWDVELRTADSWEGAVTLTVGRLR